MFTNQSIGGHAQPGFSAPRFKQQGCFFGKKFGGGHPWMHRLHQFMGDSRPANIEETASAFVISLYAAGLQKEHFKISVKEEMLTIGYTVPEQGAPGPFIYQEYQPDSFERSFQLSNKVLTNDISASYTDGVLKITLQKNPETNKPGQEITIA
ncbi:Hsp20/alpha crystallin family protein [Niabella drilacis]|uniref:HSP20 family protein n=1 Tax=Niabella drilacis (strain DSM 25811 / CCM 8410 / CCUG 62505 / LMG 26954 / E90) TaxID=1285928 RepID=A0A1G6J4C1_NIADE|nr:Hsp20/alpha crystallin family protein [Niabella drilacis]SDC12786.1 HSP20 family protein [Niabella drilacis]